MSPDVTRPGTVYLVGAGPGHPGLVTRMGYEVLQRCDAVAYDALIPLELIAALPERVERHYVGRRAGRHSMPQADKNQLLVDLASRGLNVVRLKGGDTSFFAGSSEEVACLAAAGIQVVVIPGVTAASAVAASSGLAITDRRAASWAFFATGHGSSCEPIPIPWREIAALPGGTIVVYMGLANLEQIVEQLLAGGTPAETPCLMVQSASTGLERVIETKLRELVAQCRREQVQPPALVVIGEVVRYRTSAIGRTEGSLKGKRVLVTCCSRETETICSLLRAHGVEPLPYPTFALEEVDDPEGWVEFDRVAASGGWCVFTSELEVGGFVEELLRHDLDLRSLGRFRIAALGGGTASALRERGLKADLISQLPLDQMLRRELGNGTQSNTGSLMTFLAGAGEMSLEADTSTGWTDIIRLRLYRSRHAAWESHWRQEIVESPVDYILFTSSMAVDGFVDLLGRETARRLADKSAVVSMGSGTVAAARRHGLRIALEAESRTMDGIVASIVRHEQEAVRSSRF